MVHNALPWPGGMMMTSASMLLSTLLMGCAAADPPTVTLDGAVFATRQPDGWHHVSGELALPTQGDRVGVLPQGPPSALDAVVQCDDGTCRFLLSGSGFEVRGAEIWRDGVHRGDITHATPIEERQVVALLSTYEPPAPVTVTMVARLEHGSADLRFSAMPSGELVRDLSCSWPERCTASEDVVGTWSASAITLDGAAIAFADVLSPKDGGWRFESTHRGRAVELTVAGKVQGAADGVWRTTPQFGGRLVPHRQPVDVDSPPVAAAFLATVVALERWWLDAAPPPPPPPPPPP